MEWGLSHLPFPLGSMPQRSPLMGLEYQVGYKNLLQCEMLVLGQRKLHFDHRNQKGQPFGVLCNYCIKAYKETSIYFHESIREDFRQFLKLRVEGF